MAYLHCHTKSCGWSQDDFWTRRYNPFTKLWSDIKWLIRPRIMEMDDWYVDDLIKYTNVLLWRFRVEFNGQARVFSWQWLWLEFRREIKSVRRQKWWTWKSWKKERDAAVCPKCGLRDFDID